MIQHRIMNGEGQKGRSKAQTTGAEGTDPEVTTIRPGRQSSVGGRVLFARGDSQLDREALASLDQIAEQVRGHRNIVFIKGHASLEDLTEKATPQDRMNLSVARAQKVSDYLMSKGVAPVNLRVEGCSTFEPLLQRAYTANAQAMNRRVEVEVSSTLVEDLQDHSAKAPTTITTPNPPAGEAEPAPAH
jgi:outer membrane protein OmpA-like peptidoglycan-associated protein